MEEKVRESYPSDLTDEQWDEIAPICGDAQLHVEQAGIDGGKRRKAENGTS